MSYPIFFATYPNKKISITFPANIVALNFSNKVIALLYPQFLSLLPACNTHPLRLCTTSVNVCAGTDNAEGNLISIRSFSLKLIGLSKICSTYPIKSALVNHVASGVSSVPEVS